MDGSRVTASFSGMRIPKLPLLISRDYTLLALGQAISSLGDAVFGTTMILWIATGPARGEAWAPAAVGALVLLEEVPQVLVGPLAGVYADRWQKKRTMLVTDGIRAGLLSLLILVTGISVVSVPGWTHPARFTVLGAVYVTIFLVTVCSQFFGPSRLSLVGDIVPAEKRVVAGSVSQSNAAISSILGPALAAPLFFGLGAGWAVGVDAFSFLASFLTIALVRVPPIPAPHAPEEASSVKHEFLDGLRVVRSNPVLRTLLIVGFMIMLGFGSLNALSIFFLQQNLHASSHVFGVLGTAQSAGFLVGAIAAGVLAERIGVDRLLWSATVLFGVLVVIYARLTSFPPALVCTVLIGLAFAALEVTETPLILRVTPRAYVGRVSAIMVPAYAAGATISALVAGWLVSTVLRHLRISLLGVMWGPYDVVFGCAGVFAIVAGLYAMTSLRRHPTELQGAQRQAVDAID